MAQDAIVVFITCPPDRASALAETLVGSGLAACVNVVPNLRSVYRWKGAVQRDDEALLIVKTARDRFEALREAVLANHSYEVPEIIALPVERGHAPYLEWIMESTR